MPRKIELKTNEFSLVEKDIEGFLERVVTPIGTSAKADIPRRFLGRRVYVIITRSREKPSKKGG